MNIISVKYDKEEDILYLYFGKNRPAVTIELENDTFLRIDPKTHELISLEFLSFSKYINTIIKEQGEISEFLG